MQRKGHAKNELKKIQQVENQRPKTSTYKTLKAPSFPRRQQVKNQRPKTSTKNPQTPLFL
jgi:hypothetical protein